MTHKVERSIFDLPVEFLAMGVALVRSGRGAAAVKLVQRMEQERPNDERLAAVGRAILSCALPEFHRGMLLDDARNGAYARAVERTAPGKRVLDIGTGSGLLAMLAARAGARHVYACEANPMLAETAREIVAANGLSDRVTVFSCRSNELDRDRDLDGGVDLVVSEILAENVVAEGVLQALEDARVRLCLPGARFVPERVIAKVALAGCPTIPPIGTVEGFDLGMFERHLGRGENLRADKAGAFLRSGAADLFDFRFDGDHPLAATGEGSVTLTSTGGRVTGVLQWLRIELADGVAYENPPGGDSSLCWVVRYVPFGTPRETSPGEPVTVGGLFVAGELLLWNGDGAAVSRAAAA